MCEKHEGEKMQLLFFKGIKFGLVFTPDYINYLFPLYQGIANLLNRFQQ